MKKKILSALILLFSFTAVVSGESADSADHSRIADSSEMTTVDEVIEEGMIPVYGDQIKDGVYSIDVNSSSSMFSIESCELTVADGEMTAVLTMGGTGYLYLYPGTPEEAAAAPEEDLISHDENEEGQHTFTFPVEVLDAPVDCAAYSKRKEQWYARTLAFKSASIPSDCIGIERTTAETLGLADGEYQADLLLGGGSGKTTVETPAVLTVADGRAMIRLVINSSNYDYVLLDSEKYENQNPEGNSIFEIPALYFDAPIPIIADSIALGRSTEIEYTLTISVPQAE